MKTSLTSRPVSRNLLGNWYEHILPRQSRGFALVVTLSLMILLTVIAVGLLTLCTIALRSSSQGAAEAAAQANARLAMMLAIGDLQKYAGPDQRVTARADILAETDPSKRNWTGVWDVDPAHNPRLISPAEPIVSSDNSKSKITPFWLVSKSGLSVPTHTAPGLGPSDITARTAVRLVGSGANPAGNDVMVPLQKMQSSATGQPNGAYAYWVGDEGVKARINLDSPGYRAAATPKDASYAFSGSPRSAIELLETAPNPATGSLASPWGVDLYDYQADTVSKLVTTGQLPLYASAGKQASARDATKARFHDLTAYSSSVLSNTADGGLRQDLTRVLADPTQGPGNADRIAPVPPGASEGSNSHHRLPVWGRLRSWWNNPVDSTSGSSLSLSAPTDPATDYITPVVAPIMVWSELGTEIFYEDLGPSAMPNRYRFRVQLFPRVALWNPYTVPFQEASYEAVLQAPYGCVVQLNLATPTTFSFASLTFNSKSTWPLRNLRFKLNAPALAPGETKIFALSSSNMAFVDGSTTLTEAGGSTDYNQNNYVYLNAANEIFDTPDVPNGDPNTAYRFKFIQNTNSNFNRLVQLKDSAGIKTFQATTLYGLKGDFKIDNTTTNPPTVAETRYIRQAQPRPQQLANPNVPGHIARMGSGINLSTQRWLAVNNILGRQQERFEGTDTGSRNPHYDGSFLLPTDPMVTTHLESARSGVKPLVLREPRLVDPGHYQSIAQFQHAPLSDNANSPLYAVGNSLQSPRILAREKTHANVTVSGTVRSVFDTSYLLNQALWDKYFFSTVPVTLTSADLAKPLPNARLQPLNTAAVASLKRYDTVASELLLLGGFNINSTSEQAWRAVLASAQKLNFDPRSGVRNRSKILKSPFSRFLAPLGDPVNAASDNLSYQGYRELSDIQIAALAAAIVAEVKTRGPFRSLGDFVNRRLVKNTDAAAPTGLKGALQAAIDAVDLAGNAPINNIAPYSSTLPNSLSGTLTTREKQAELGMVSGVATAPVSSRSAFGPGYLTQADVLSRIGSAISARSDTFVIRTYGEARNPATQEVTGRAWAEAVVQRMPEFVDQADTKLSPLGAATPVYNADGSTALNSTNTNFGRHFKVISFRWLGANDL